MRTMWSKAKSHFFPLKGRKKKKKRKKAKRTADGGETTMKATEKMKTVKRASQEKKKTRTRDQGELDVNDAISHTLKKKKDL